VVAPGKYRSPPPYVAAELQAEDAMTGRVVYVELAAAMELVTALLVTEGISEERCVVLPVEPAFVLLVCGLFFHGWNPLPTAASARGGGDLLDSLLHCAASIASGVPRSPGWSCNSSKTSA
jgi:hypothetical protein